MESYEILGIKPNANSTEIISKFRQLLIKYDPSNPDNISIIRQLNTAYLDLMSKQDDKSSISEYENLTLDNLKLSQYISLIKLFLIFAEIDGQIHDEEQKVINAFCQVHWLLDFNISIQQIYEDMNEELTPDYLFELIKSLHNISKTQKQVIIKWIALIVKADGVSNTKEESLFELLAQAWSGSE